MPTLTVASYETIQFGFPPMTFKADEDNPPNLNFPPLSLEHLQECAQTHPHRVHGTGHGYMAYNTTMWTLETQGQYPGRTQYPGAAMRYPPGINDLECANGTAALKVMFEDHQDEQTMYHALINRLYAMLRPYAMDIKDDARDLGNPTFLQVKVLAMAEWGHSTPQDRANDLNGLSAKWHPSQGVEQLFSQGKETIA